MLILTVIIVLTAALGSCYTTGEPIPFELELGTVAGVGTLEITKVDPIVTTPLPPKSTEHTEVSSDEELKDSPTRSMTDEPMGSGTETDAGVTAPTTTTTEGKEDPAPRDSKIESVDVTSFVETITPASTTEDTDSVCTDLASPPPESSPDPAPTTLKHEDNTSQSTTSADALTRTVVSTKTITRTRYVPSISGSVGSTAPSGTHGPRSYRSPPVPNPTADFALSSGSSTRMLQFSSTWGLCIVLGLFASMA